MPSVPGNSLRIIQYNYVHTLWHNVFNDFVDVDNEGALQNT